MQPYLGLRPYTEKDQDNFFGRAPEKRIIVDKILTNKLTLLFAASGVGKSSLLQAAVIPELKTGENLDVVYHCDWFDDPAANLKQTVVDYLKQPGKVSDDELPNNVLPLNTFFQAGTRLTSQPLVIILDQFEEFFNYQRYRKAFKPFIKQLATAILDSETATTFVISMREDFALELNAFQPELPMLLFNNFYRLEKLTKDMAKQAIVNPLKPYGFHYETGLLETLLDDLSRREQIESVDLQTDYFWDAPIEPPHLQIVCTLLWKKDANNPAKQITQTTYENEGQAIGLLTSYLDNCIQALSVEDKKLASLAFNYLVSKYGTKMAYPVGELAQLLNVEVQALTQTLNQLERASILRKQFRPPAFWYELYHDIFAKGVYEWNEIYQDQQSYCLRLHATHDIEDEIELYQGTRQPHYLYEIGYSRADLEPDRVFIHQMVPTIEAWHLDLIELLPFTKRIVAYYNHAEITKSLTLANVCISTYDIPLSEYVLENLSTCRSVENARTLQVRLQSEKDVDLKKKLISTLGQIQSLFQMTFVLRPFLKDENRSVRLDTIKILAQSGEIEAIKPLIELLKDSDSVVRYHAIDGLVQLEALEAVKPLIELLKDSNSDVRGHAVDGLVQLKTPEAVKPLIELLKDSNSDVRRHAVDGLVQLRAPKAVKPLIELLKESDFQVLRHAIDGLVQLKAREAVKPLIKLLKESDSYVYEPIIDGLVQFGEYEVVVKFLIELLKNHDSDSIHRQATFKLAQLGAHEAIKPLIELLKNKDSNTRDKAAQKLVYLGAREAVKPLIELFKDNNYYVCDSAVMGVMQLGTRETVKPLIELLKDNDEKVRYNAAKCLARLDVREGVKSLIELLQNNEARVRYHAVEGLVQWGTPEVVKPLITELLKDSSSGIRGQAINWLMQLGAREEAIKLLIGLLKESDSSVRQSAIKKLAYLGSPEEAIKPLIELLKDSNPSVRSSAADGLAELGTHEAVKPLIELLKDSNSSVRSSAAYELAKLGTHEAIKPLIELLKDSDSHMVRCDVIDRLVQLGALEAVKPLIELLKDSDSSVRSSAANGLAKLGTHEAVKPLIELLKDSKSSVRSSAANGLAKLGMYEALPLIELLKDSDYRVCCYAINGLVQLGALEEVVKPLIKLLKDSNYFVRSSAADGLVKLGTRQAIKPLLDLLKDSDKNVRWCAITTLTQLEANHKELLPVLAETIKNLQENSRHFSADERKEAAIKLGHLFLTQSVVLLTPLLEDWHLAVKTQAIDSLETLASKWVESKSHPKTQRLTHPMKPALLTTPEPLESVHQIISALSALWTDTNINIRRKVVTAISKIVLQLPAEEKTLWLEKFANLAQNRQELLSIRVIALNTLAKWGTDKAAKIIINLLQSTPPDIPSVELVALHALGQISSKMALDFLCQRLTDLSARKQAWRHQRDAGQPVEHWQYRQWETELGYAIARLAPETIGIELLAHNMAEVRKGAWIAIGTIGHTVIIKTLIEKYQDSQPEAVHFRHATFQAIDGNLKIIEHKGKQPDLAILQALLPSIKQIGIKDRVEWTILSLEKQLLSNC